MRKFFVKENQINNNVIEIVSEDVNHIKNVLRLDIGEKIKICDSDNKINYICEITQISKQNVICNILEKAQNEAEGNVELHIFQGLPKADKMELIIQKGTELGATKFIPVSFKRSIVKLSGKDELKKIDRWQKIAEVASKQSMRDMIPEVTTVMSVKELVKCIPEYDVFLLAYEMEKETYIKSILKNLDKKDRYKIAVAIGPEGGIDEEEVRILKNAGAKVISLGNRILRTETVALQVSSIIMYELEE